MAVTRFKIQSFVFNIHHHWSYYISHYVSWNSETTLTLVALIVLQIVFDNIHSYDIRFCTEFPITSLVESVTVLQSYNIHSYYIAYCVTLLLHCLLRFLLQCNALNFGSRNSITDTVFTCFKCRAVRNGKFHIFFILKNLWFKIKILYSNRRKNDVKTTGFEKADVYLQSSRI